MRVSRNDIGRTCSVAYDDVGDITGLIVDVDNEWVSVFEPYNSLSKVAASQIVKMGSRIQFGGLKP